MRKKTLAAVTVIAAAALVGGTVAASATTSHKTDAVGIAAPDLANAGVHGQARGVMGTTGITKPLATGIADPGVLHTDKGWVNLSTGNARQPGHIHVAKALSGHWRSTGKPLLTSVPKWMSKRHKSVWAPSIVRATDGSYRVFYAGVVRGQYPSRCIGTGYGKDPRGPFKPYQRPVSCYHGSGAHADDTIGNEGGGMSLIDPTPARVGGQLVLTYKTQRKHGLWHTTQRMVRLNPAHPQRTVANPVHRSGASVRLTNSWDKYIEENPVLVQRGHRYTLFTSFGWFGTCHYWTRYRQNTSLWHGWLSKSPARLRFPASAHTCGTGNAQVTQGLPKNSWRIMFNGHPDAATKGGPDGLYAGVVRWTRAGKPYVSGLLH